MNSVTVKSMIVSALSDYGFAVVAVLGFFLTIGVSYLIFKWGFSQIWHMDGTTNPLGRHWSWWDQHTYKPYPGYHRFRSREWNMKNTFK